LLAVVSSSFCLYAVALWRGCLGLFWPDRNLRGGGRSGWVVLGIGQERLGPSNVFISSALGPLSSLSCKVPSSRYIWSDNVRKKVTVTVVKMLSHRCLQLGVEQDHHSGLHIDLTPNLPRRARVFVHLSLHLRSCVREMRDRSGNTRKDPIFRARQKVRVVVYSLLICYKGRVEHNGGIV
jgi:hypothetical protein